MNLMMLLEMAAGAYGDRVAFQNGDDALTYQQLFDAAGALAADLADGRTQHLAMLDESSLALPVAVFGASWAGVPFAPLNYRLTDPELDSLVSQLQPGRLITEPERRDRLGERIDAAEGEHFVSVHTTDELLATARADGAAPRDEPWSMEMDDTAILLFTSGTTGAPKAAVLRQKHLVSYVLGSVEFMGAERGRRVAVLRPALSHRRDGGHRERRLLGAPRRPDAEVRRRGLDRDGAQAGRDPRDGRADDARADRRRARGRAGRLGSPEPSQPRLRRRQDAAVRDREGDGALPRDELHERLRAHRDELDDLAARPRRPPRGDGQRRSGRAPAHRLGRSAAADDRGQRSATSDTEAPVAAGERGTHLRAR